MKSVFSRQCLASVDSRRLEKCLNCSCGHTVAHHSQAGGCLGLTREDASCTCRWSSAQALDRAVTFFAGLDAAQAGHGESDTVRVA